MRCKIGPSAGPDVHNPCTARNILSSEGKKLDASAFRHGCQCDDVSPASTDRRTDHSQESSIRPRGRPAPRAREPCTACKFLSYRREEKLVSSAFKHDRHCAEVSPASTKRTDGHRPRSRHAPRIRVLDRMSTTPVKLSSFRTALTFHRAVERQSWDAETEAQTR